jgi:hypothetical protein
MSVDTLAQTRELLFVPLSRDSVRVRQSRLSSGQAEMLEAYRVRPRLERILDSLKTGVIVELPRGIGFVAYNHGQNPEEDTTLPPSLSHTKQVNAAIYVEVVPTPAHLVDREKPVRIGHLSLAAIAGIDPTEYCQDNPNPVIPQWESLMHFDNSPLPQRHINEADLALAMAKLPGGIYTPRPESLLSDTRNLPIGPHRPFFLGTGLSGVRQFGRFLSNYARDTGIGQHSFEQILASQTHQSALVSDNV